jgi:hypothetical protein
MSEKLCFSLSYFIVKNLGKSNRWDERKMCCRLKNITIGKHCLNEIVVGVWAGP